MQRKTNGIFTSGSPRLRNQTMRVLLWSLLLSSVLRAQGQELYPLSEPASTMPYRTLGVRLFSETYKEVNQWRNMSALRLQYGLLPRLTGYLTFVASNHHGEKMPEDFPFHNTPERGKYYPFKFNGVHLYGKYRFLSLDGPRTHFRLAAYGEASWVNTTHHETEASLVMGDNSGVGLGLITTYLYRKFAVSLTSGLIFPVKTEGYSPDPIPQLPEVPVRLYHGNNLTYSLSFGYLLFPKRYTSYDQGNVNLYLELSGKAYQTAKVDLYIGLPNEYYIENAGYPPALQAGYYLDLSPGVQYIYKSNLRIDFSTSFRFLGYSYARLYPVFTLGVQHYFYNKR